MSIFVRARFEALPGLRADFEQVALALRAQAGTEPGTRTYRWFSADDGSFVVVEEYADPAAALRHNERAAPLLDRVSQCATMVSVELYGPIGPELAAWARERPQVTVFPDLPLGDQPADADPPGR